MQKAHEKFSYLKYFDKIDDSIINSTKDLSALSYDLFVCLDCADINRLDKNSILLEKSKESIAIDHHISHKKYAKQLLLDANASSTCEVLSRYLDISKFNKDIATCIYTGLVHDTGVFKYPSTSVETMQLAAKLIGYGVEFSKIIDESYFVREFALNKILAKALIDSELYLENKLICSYTTKQTMDYYKFDCKKLDGIIDELRNTKDIEVAIYFYEVDKDMYKVSLRSKEYVDVSLIASYFGGGGHIRAAGCTLKGEAKDIIDTLIKKVKEQI